MNKSIFLWDAEGSFSQLPHTLTWAFWEPQTDATKFMLSGQPMTLPVWDPREDRAHVLCLLCPPKGTSGRLSIRAQHSTHTKGPLLQGCQHLILNAEHMGMLCGNSEPQKELSTILIDNSAQYLQLELSTAPQMEVVQHPQTELNIVPPGGNQHTHVGTEPEGDPNSLPQSECGAQSWWSHTLHSLPTFL